MDSYNCTGCRGNKSIRLKITAQGTVAGIPTISELKKLPSRINVPPKAHTTATRSKNQA